MNCQPPRDTVALELALMTRDDVADIAPRAILVIPTAATEQHGPHLPLGTDSMIGEAVARGALNALDGDVCAVLAPLLVFGSSHHHLVYNALSISTSGYLYVLGDLLRSALDSGFRRFLVLNSHGGNAECIRLATRDLAVANEAFTASCSYWDVSRRDIESAVLGHLGDVPGHAGQFETCLMLAIAPRLVRLTRLPEREGQRRPTRATAVLDGLSVHGHGDWRDMDGYTDTPIEPTPEQGRTLLTIISRSVAEAITEFHKATAKRMAGTS